MKLSLGKTSLAIPTKGAVGYIPRNVTFYPVIQGLSKRLTELFKKSGII